MPDIAIYNETDYDLTPLMLDFIRSDAIEHFGELIRAIRVQPHLNRHAFNTKTREVRYAFYPSDYEVVDPIAFSDQDALLPAFDDADEDETLIAGIDGDLDDLDSDDDAKFAGFNPDYHSIETTDPESFYEDDEAFEPSQS